MGKKQKKLRAKITLMFKGMTALLNRLFLETDSFEELSMLDAEVNQAWVELQPVLDAEAITVELCMAWVEMLTRWHRLSFEIALDNQEEAAFLSYARGTDYIHADLWHLLPEGMNEGSKCWPPDDPECQ